MPAQIVYDVSYSIQYIYGRIMCTSIYGRIMCTSIYGRIMCTSIYNANMGVSWYYMCTSSVLYS